MSTRAVTQMASRMMKSVTGGVNVAIKSLKQTSVQVVLGLILVVYIAFLESDRESVLSVLMGNAMGRVFVLGFLALLAVAAPPVAILFAVLVVMSYNNSEGMTVQHTEGFASCGTDGEEEEGFWQDDKKDDDKKDDDKKDDDKKGDKNTIADQLKSAIDSVMGGGDASKDKKEGFGPMYEGPVDEEEFENEEDARRMMDSMRSLGGILGYNGESEHPSV